MTSREPALLLRGTPLIICDSDRPEARMVACLINYDAKAGRWNARYLSPKTNMRVCWSTTKPTPLADFGVRLIICSSQYRAVATDLPSIATYRDGKPRHWQEVLPSPMCQSRADAFELLKVHLDRDALFNANAPAAVVPTRRR